jgi:hypothetical protein
MPIINNNGNSTGFWEVKVLLIAGVIILVILLLIAYSYKLTNNTLPTAGKDGFKTYGELADELNATRTALMNIKSAQNQKILDIDTNVGKYIDGDVIFPDELKDKLIADFDVRFSQQLQDADITDLNRQLDELRKKTVNLPAAPTKYMLKNLGGSAFNMLGTPNDFSLQINPSNAKCLSFSQYGINNPETITGVGINGTGTEQLYKSAGDVQCDIGGSNKSQRFKLSEITSNQDFNKLVGETYAVPPYYTLNNYPFMVAQPIDGTVMPSGMIKECITFDNSGLSVEPCNGSETQRWHTYPVNN